MDRLMPFDELNVLDAQVKNIFETQEPEKRKDFADYVEDAVLEILVMSYVYGNEAANEMLGTSEEISQESLTESLDKKIKGENWIQRVQKYMTDESATAEDVIRVAETDAHRIYNEAIYEVGRQAESKTGVILKTWETMLDDRVRDTHSYLEGMTIPFDERFFTYDGDSADHPGDFFTPENNVNCRCRIRLST